MKPSPLHIQTPAKALMAALFALLLAIGGFAVSSAIAPASAQALQVTSLTAQPNEDGGKAILGGTPTRISWRAQCDEGESLSAIVIGLPANLEYDTSGVKVTGLDGLDRVDLSYELSVDADNALHVDFTTPSPEGIAFLIEVYQASFPAEGGAFTFYGSYTTSEGIPIDLGVYSTAIEVTGISAAEKISSWLAKQPFVQAWNSNKFLHMFLDPTIMVTSFPQVFKGWLTALGLVLCGIPCAVPLGFLAALLRMSKFRPLRAIASVYVNVIRGTPMFLQIYIAFFGLPLLGMSVGKFPLAVAVMSFNSGAYLCEIFRAGIESINKGQFEASRSLGMSASQTMMHVIIPQAFRRVLPTMTNEFILLYKDTSLLAAVGLMETVMYAKVITASTGNITPYIVAAIFYLIVTIPLSTFTRHLEDRTANRRTAQRKRTEKKAAKQRNMKDGSPWTPDPVAEKDVLAIKTADL